MTSIPPELVPFAIVAAFLVGACIGSFLNVCISRWPVGLSIVSPPSRCPHCERPVRAYENVPIFGWLALRGRCRGCRERISVQYPLVELLVGLVWAAAVWHYGTGFTAVRVAVFVTTLIGIAVTDAKHYLIPDGFTLFGSIWVIVTALAALFVSEVSPFAMPYDALIGAFTGAGAIAIAGWLGEVTLKREAMGFGDVTLMAMAGAALGPDRALLTIFVAAGIGVIVFVGVVYPTVWLRSRLGGRRNGASTVNENAEGDAAGDLELPLVPFGVFLAPAAVVALFFGDTLVRWYGARFLGV